MLEDYVMSCFKWVVSWFKKKSFFKCFLGSKRVINLGPVHIGSDSPEPRHQPVGLRVICGHCANTFLVNGQILQQAAHILSLVLIFPFLLFHTSSGRRFQTGLWPDVHTAEKCKHFCSCLHLLETDPYICLFDLWLDQVCFKIKYFSLFIHQFFSWSAIPEEEELAVFSALCYSGSIHRWTFGEFLSVLNCSGKDRFIYDTMTFW